ncbi:MAG: M20/M25/M40 family metallo-hydrolase [Bacteroidia bacterium]|nr:M20/M25/M40 family metallo-hydrolase [Bacteroidia bacterium]
MKPTRMIALMAVALLATGLAKAQHDPIQMGLNAITKEAIKGQLDFLASDWTEGRETSTKGEFMAGDFIASVFQIYGVQPAGDMAGGGYSFSADQMYLYMSGDRPKMAPPTRSYFQNIPFVQTLTSESSMELITKEGSVERRFLLSKGNDYNFWGGGTGQDITAPVVFVGYGYKNDSIGYDDFKGIDVKGKIVLRINGLPGMKDTLSVAYKKLNLKDRNAMYKTYEVKDNLLKKFEIAGVIDYPGYPQGSPANYPFRFNTRIYEGDKRLSSGQLDISLPVDTLTSAILNISASPKILTELMNGAGINIKEFEENAAKLKPGSKEMKGKSIHLINTVTTQTVRGRNVLAKIEGENPNEVIVVGAHYDHLGTYNGYIWNGADDNASGTVGVMTLAKAFIASRVKPKKTIIFAAWTGEEKGLLGSNYWVDKYPKKENLVLNLNFDMISRRPEKDTSGFKAGMDFTEAYPILKNLVDSANTKYELGLEIKFRPSKQPMAGTDFTPFSMKKVPIYGFDAAFTADYHGPMDHSDKANLDLMQKIIKAGFVSLYELANTEGKIGGAK